MDTEQYEEAVRDYEKVIKLQKSQGEQSVSMSTKILTLASLYVNIIFSLSLIICYLIFQHVV